ncbi:MAG: phosphoribosylformylglycinamidine synthase I [Candidatus Zapsychrus exili]|nr:phosphoribosylformylglycinamidine synthase I [Candidatus Zapsychrus exili]
MSKKVKVIVIRTAGTNCDEETAFAFKAQGADTDLVHINRLLEGKTKLDSYHILAIPGGFTYGDDIESGRILANELRLYLIKSINKFIKDGKLIIGICNGFQVLVKSGFLPGLSNKKINSFKDLPQDVTLISNDSSKFEDRWTYLKTDGKSIWTEGLGETVYYPVAHAEGKFVVKSKKVLEELKKNKQIIFRYCNFSGNKPVYPENPNGSIDNIAGISDKTGRILGLMPHPERHFSFTQHPFWTRLERKSDFGDGALIFKNGVNYAKKNLIKG